MSGTSRCTTEQAKFGRPRPFARGSRGCGSASIELPGRRRRTSPFRIPLTAALALGASLASPGCAVKFEDWALLEEVAGGGHGGEGGEAGATSLLGGAGTGGAEVAGGERGLPEGGEGGAGEELAGAGGASLGGTTTGGAATGGEGGVPASGGSTGGTETGGVETGGTDSGGTGTGGDEPGGTTNGGEAAGGTESGGIETGGAATGGTSTGGMAGAPAAGGDGGEPLGGAGGDGGATACDEGFIDCDDDGVCEVNPLDDPDACGGCGIRCTDDHGTPVCVDGACDSLCDDGFEDCPGSADYRCETDTTGDVNNCGDCARVCPADQGVPWCQDSDCGFTECVAGTGDCDGNGSCETNLNISDDHCGACGNPCDPQDGTGNCLAGTCEIAGCDTGFDDCDGEYDTGCETSLGTPTDCGSCGDDCADIHMTACADGQCQTCATGYGDCTTAAGCETNITADPNCGGCGIDCVTNTGTSSNPCNGTACLPVCVSGYGNCDGNAANGCEENLTNDAQNCGACGVNCSGATPYCVNVSGSTWACRGNVDIAAVNYKSGTGSATTTVSHTMATAESASTTQMILVGVAGYGNSAGGAEPSSVKYNNVTMTKVGTGRYQNNSYAGIYFLLDADLPGAGTYNVLSTKSDLAGTVLNIIELTGVRQVVPAAHSGSAYGNCGTADPISTIAIGSVGSWTYDIAAAFGGNTGGTALAGPQGAPAATKTVDVLGPDSMLGIGGYRGPYNTTGSYTGVGWSLTSCNGGSHVIVALEPGTGG